MLWLFRPWKEKSFVMLQGTLKIYQVWPSPVYLEDHSTDGKVFSHSALGHTKCQNRVFQTLGVTLQVTGRNKTASLQGWGSLKLCSLKSLGSLKSWVRLWACWAALGFPAFGCLTLDLRCVKSSSSPFTDASVTWEPSDKWKAQPGSLPCYCNLFLAPGVW